MKNVLPNYVFANRYEEFTFMEGGGPSTHIIQELLNCTGPVDAIFYDDINDLDPSLELKFDSPEDVKVARSHPETWERMGPIGYLYAEASEWGVYASLCGEVTVVGYNGSCKPRIENIKALYDDIMWSCKEIVPILLPSPFNSPIDRDVFLRQMEFNYSHVHKL